MMAGDSDHAEDDDGVGYKRPPKATRFKPGQSGNRRGRPRTPKTPGLILQRALDRKLYVTVDGRRKRITTWEAMISKMLSDALTGDAKARRILFEYAVDTGYAPTPEGLLKMFMDDQSGSPRVNRVVSLMILGQDFEKVGLAKAAANGDLIFDEAVLGLIKERTPPPPPKKPPPQYINEDGSFTNGRHFSEARAFYAAQAKRQAGSD